LHISLHVERRIELGFLGEVADTGALHGPRFALEVGIDPGHDAKERALARPVGADDPDLGTGKEREADVLEDLPPGRDDLAQPVHVVDELLLGHVRAEGAGRGAAAESRSATNLPHSRVNWRWESAAGSGHV